MLIPIASKALAGRFYARGSDTTPRSRGFSVEKGQSHVIGTLTGEGSIRLFQEMEACSK